MAVLAGSLLTTPCSVQMHEILDESSADNDPRDQDTCSIDGDSLFGAGE
jgi:hypothetical protein